jgi:PAS domain S-box-containing protein
VRWFRDLSIRHKLVVLGAAAALVALLAATASFLIYDQATFRDALVRKLESQAEILAINSASALMFGDDKAALDTIGALRADDDVLRAALYTQDRRLFVRYTAPAATGAEPPPELTATRRHEFGNGRLQLTEPVIRDGEVVGAVWIESGMSELVERRWGYVIIGLPVLAGSILLAYLISSRLQRVISRPIFDVADAARRISRDKDYSVRVVPESRDELGQLVGTFNEMLDQIQRRDEELQRAREELERRVEVRTADLRAELAERRRTESALVQSERLLADAQRLAHVGSWEWDVARDRIVWSEELYRIYGTDPAEPVQSFRAFLDRVHPGDRETVQRRIEEALEQTGSFSLEHRIVRPDGTERVLSAVGHTVADDSGRVLRMFGTGQDVTERHRAEQDRVARTRAESAQAEALAAQRRADLLAEIGSELASSLESEPALEPVLRLLVPALADWAALHLIDGSAVRLAAVADRDPELAELTRQMERSAPGTGWAGWIDTVLRESRARLLAAADAGSRSASESADARRLFGQALAAPLSARGKNLGVLTLGVRGSERWFDQVDLSLGESIAGRIANAIDNARLYREAQQANRMKDEFLATLSHELRTPLHAIVGWVSILRERELDEKLMARAIETIGRNAQLQTQLIEDMLDVSRIVSGKLKLDVRPVELHRVVEAAVDSVKPAADAKEIRLRQELDTEMGATPCDPGRLQQVVWNLLSNAIKFTPRGGCVTVRLERGGDQARITVTDTGVGIPVEFLDRIFERFSQVDASSTRTHRGLGLGLAIVRHLVELHGGTVEASSPGPDRGSTFVVRLPLRAVRATAESRAGDGAGATETDSRDRRLGGVRVLVVDDEEDARELVATLLRRMGAEVGVAASAAEAMTLIERERPDVLLSDVEMPHEDGYSLIRRVRRLPAERGGDVPAAAVTAYARPEDRQRALDAGFQSHVAKPIEPALLADLVLDLVSNAPRTGRTR